MSYKPMSSLAFDAIHSGGDEDGQSRDVRNWGKRGRVMACDVVRDQREMDEMCPRTHVFDCPKEYLFVTLYGFALMPVDGSSEFWDWEDDEDLDEATISAK
jgi:hypothetical protein